MVLSIPNRTDENRNPRNTAGALPSILEPFRDDITDENQNFSNFRPPIVRAISTSSESSNKITVKGPPGDVYKPSQVYRPNMAGEMSNKQNDRPHMTEEMPNQQSNRPQMTVEMSNQHEARETSNQSEETSVRSVSAKQTGGEIPDSDRRLDVAEQEEEMNISENTNNGKVSDNTSDATEHFDALSMGLEQFESKFAEFTSGVPMDTDYNDYDYNIPALSDFDAASTVYGDALSETGEKSVELEQKHDQTNIVETQTVSLKPNVKQGTEDTSPPVKSKGLSVGERRPDRNVVRTQRPEIIDSQSEGAVAAQVRPVIGLNHGMRDGIYWRRGQDTSPQTTRGIPHSFTAPVNLTEDSNVFKMHRSFSTTPYSYRHPPPLSPRVAPPTLDWGHDYTGNSELNISGGDRDNQGGFFCV